MDIQRLRDPGAHAKMRAVLGKILIEEGLSLSQLSAQANVAPCALTWFLKNELEGKIGIKTLLKLAHFISTKGYDVEKELS